MRDETELGSTNRIDCLPPYRLVALPIMRTNETRRTVHVLTATKVGGTYSEVPVLVVMLLSGVLVVLAACSSSYSAKERTDAAATLIIEDDNDKAETPTAIALALAAKAKSDLYIAILQDRRDFDSARSGDSGAAAGTDFGLGLRLGLGRSSRKLSSNNDLFIYRAIF